MVTMGLLKMLEVLESCLDWCFVDCLGSSQEWLDNCKVSFNMQDTRSYFWGSVGCCMLLICKPFLQSHSPNPSTLQDPRWPRGSGMGMPSNTELGWMMGLMWCDQGEENQWDMSRWTAGAAPPLPLGPVHCAGTNEPGVSNSLRTSLSTIKGHQTEELFPPVQMSSTAHMWALSDSSSQIIDWIKRIFHNMAECSPVV